VLGTGQGVVLDRSVFSDTVFAEANVKDGNISPAGVCSPMSASSLPFMPYTSASLSTHLPADLLFRQA